VWLLLSVAGNAVLRDLSDWRRISTELIEVHLEMDVFLSVAQHSDFGDMSPQDFTQR